MPMRRILRNPRKKLTHTIKQQLEYTQGQINKIRNLVEDRQSWISWQTVNELSWRKSKSRTKLEAVSQEKRLLKWKEHFKNLFESPPEITDKSFQNF